MFLKKETTKDIQKEATKIEKRTKITKVSTWERARRENKHRELKNNVNTKITTTKVIITRERNDNSNQIEEKATQNKKNIWKVHFTGECSQILKLFLGF